MSDAPPVTKKQLTGKAIFMLRDWLDELEKIERDIGASNGLNRPHCSKSKRHLDADGDDAITSLSGESVAPILHHADKTDKKTKTGTIDLRKDKKNSLSCDSGFLVLNNLSVYS